MLTEQLEETVASLDGARVDAAVYAQLGPDDLELVRAALQESDREPAFDDAGDEAHPDEDADRAQEDEEEILRLQEELDLSGRLQAALERYLEVL